MAEVFTMVPLPAGRSRTKPRRQGLTMMMDWGMPIESQASLLGLVAPHVDLAKIVVGTARLYEESYLRRKLATYRDHDIAPFIGGQFLEYVIRKQGVGGVDAFLDEACRLGFGAIEVSDNIVPISEENRRKIIKMALSRGLEVHAEVGSKHDASTAEALVAQATRDFDAGANVILVEGAELLRNRQPDQALIAGLKEGLDLSRVIFELSGPWIPGTHHTDVYALKVFLVKTFGPDVNLANILPDAVWETEALRMGLSAPGPIHDV
ncbi:phosphosulfolactate synthase [Chelativorans sp. AA-79]|uniref:phosphosulfolactate synthase n=1 Tax=Chelativorans sp. AA-79 TaxID=3028735 RepID=UPI0023F9E3FC|nr:phosphosulfolactate synthase [Chelativorans sp. AA-79]WEX12421.1 phosphosulfolactate synthase [Chelativorans sp. AA-79]